MVGGVNAATELDRATAQSWTWSLPFHLTSVPQARRLVSQTLGARGVRSDLVADSLSVLSELVGNALRHARPRTDGDVEVVLTLDEDAIVIAVADGGAVTVPSIVSPAPMARSGRGLGIVHTLTRDWGVKETASGNIVFGILGRS
jgi:serine/threonine-protein kinase RsbW